MNDKIFREIFKTPRFFIVGIVFAIFIGLFAEWEKQTEARKQWRAEKCAEQTAWELDMRAKGWYLDGVSPSKQDLWRHPTINGITKGYHEYHSYCR